MNIDTLIPGTNFFVREFVPKEIFYNPLINPFWFINPKIVQFIVFQRKRYNLPVLLNNWGVGGDLNNRVFRMPNCTDGSSLDPHHLLLAVDYDVIGMSADAVRSDIIKNFVSIYKPMGITRIELNVNWNHNDMMWIPDLGNEPFTFTK